MLKKESQDKLKISVAVVLYNPSRENIMRTIRNFNNLNKLENKYSFEFYAIDNSSDIKCVKELKEQSKNCQNLIIKHLVTNKGFGAGHNSVINDLNSEFHIIMNPDIELDDLYGFDRAIEYMVSHRKVVLISPMIENADGTIQYLNRRKHTVFDLLLRFVGPNILKKRQDYFVKKSTGYDKIQPDENATGCFMILRTSIFKHLKGFDEKFFLYFEDADLSYRFEQKGSVIFYPYFHVKHIWKRDNHSISGINHEIKSMVVFFNKWGWKFF